MNFRQLGTIRPEVTAELGALLGTYHSETGIALTESPQSRIFPRKVPWILSSERRNSHPFKQLSPATAELFDLVERSQVLSSALDELRDDWKASTLMHGDLKLENCILFRNDSNSKFEFTIVDWELADIGDPCWNIASILQSFLSARIMSLPPCEVPISFRDMLTQSESILSFWKQYVEKLLLEAKESEKLLERRFRYAAARIIQSAYEYMQFSPHLSINASRLTRSEHGSSNQLGVFSRRVAEIEQLRMQAKLVKDLLQIVRTVKVLSPGSLTFAGNTSSLPDPEDSAALTRRSAMIQHLGRLLYLHCYSRRFEGRISDFTHSVDEQFVNELSAANSSREYFDKDGKFSASCRLDITSPVRMD